MRANSGSLPIPGKREGFLGEVDDILAATDHLAKLPCVDPDQIYLGGHSTGATMVMLVAECTSHGSSAVAAASQYGGTYVYCDVNDKNEIALLLPYPLAALRRESAVRLRSANRGNWAAVQTMVDRNSNPKIQFFKVPGHNHFSLIAPLVEKLAAQIVSGQINVTQQTLQDLK